MQPRRCRAGFRCGEGDIDRLTLVGLATIFTDPNAIEVFGFQTIPIGKVIVVGISTPVGRWCVGIKTHCVENLLEHCAFFGIPFDSDAMSGKLCNVEARRCRAGFRGSEHDIDRLALITLAAVFAEPHTICRFRRQGIPYCKVIGLCDSIPSRRRIVRIERIRRLTSRHKRLEQVAFFGIPFESDGMSGKLCNVEACGSRASWQCVEREGNRLAEHILATFFTQIEDIVGIREERNGVSIRAVII